MFPFSFFPFFVTTATSSKDDLHRRIGGRCFTDNMKVVFKVCCQEDKDKEQQQHNNITSLLPPHGSGNGGNGNANNNMNNNIPADHQQTPTHQSTGVSINTNIAKTKTPSFAQQVPSSTNTGGSINSGRFIPSINSNSSNIVQSTMNWPQQTSSSSSHNNNNNNNHHQQPFYPSYVTSPRTPQHNSANNYNNNNNNSPSTSQTSLSHKPTKKTSKYLFVHSPFNPWQLLPLYTHAKYPNPKIKISFSILLQLPTL